MSRVEEPRGRRARPAEGGPSRAGAPARGIARGAAIAIALASVVAIAFLPALDNGFVDAWDDGKNILRNVHFRGLGPSQVRWAWTTLWLGVYQPIGWMILEAQYAAWGLDPRGYHAVSLAFHALNAALLSLLAVALLDRCLPEEARRDRTAVHLGAATAAGLFAVHPLRVEPVAWVSSQSYLPCASFAMLSVLAYLMAHEPAGRTRTGWLAGSWSSLAASLLCKATSTGIPLVLLILDIYPLRRLGPGRWRGPEARRAWVEKLPFLGLSVLFAMIGAWAKRSDSAMRGVAAPGIGDRLLVASYGACLYPLKTLWPTGLVAFYPIPRGATLSDWPFRACALTVASVTASLTLLRHRWPGLLAAWSSYLAILAPNLGLAWIGIAIAADRYSYLASTPGVVLLAYGVGRLASAGRPRRLVRAGILLATTALVISLAALTWRQCRTWRDSEALWAHAAEVGGDRAAVARTNLGQIAASRGDLRSAEAHYREALRIDPGQSLAHQNLAAVLERRGRPEEALTHLFQAVRTAPDSPWPRLALGSALLRRGRPDEAVSHLSWAVGRLPDHAPGHASLALALARRGRLEEAIAQYDEAIRLDPGPGSARARSNYGLALARRGRLEEAIAQLSASARLDPKDADALVLLGAALSRAGRTAEAEARLAEALRLDPVHPRARLTPDAILGPPASPSDRP